MSETALLRKILLRASALGLRLFRNQVGTYHLPDGRWLTSGLCVGSSDLIGWTPLIITQDMVGSTVAVFTAVETKAPKGVATGPQLAFLAAVRQAGGFASVARSVEDVERLTRGDEYVAVGIRQASPEQHPLGHVRPSSGAS